MHYGKRSEWNISVRALCIGSDYGFRRSHSNAAANKLSLFVEIAAIFINPRAQSVAQHAQCRCGSIAYAVVAANQ